jgi:hypothetical protein
MLRFVITIFIALLALTPAIFALAIPIPAAAIEIESKSDVLPRSNAPAPKENSLDPEPPEDPYETWNRGWGNPAGRETASGAAPEPAPEPAPAPAPQKKTLAQHIASCFGCGSTSSDYEDEYPEYRYGMTPVNSQEIAPRH